MIGRLLPSDAFHNGKQIHTSLSSGLFPCLGWLLFWGGGCWWWDNMKQRKRIVNEETLEEKKYRLTM